MTDIIVSPLISVYALIGLGVMVLLPVLLAIMTRQRGAVLRLLGAALLLMALANPSFMDSDRQALKDVVAVVVDRSGSQTLATRSAQTEAALADVTKKLNALGTVDLRIIETAGPFSEDTRLFAALENGLADVPPERIGGAILITDGLAHDVPPTPDTLGFHAPLHALITGYPKERDRRMALIDVPHFGLVGKEVILRLTVTDSGSDEPVPLTIRRDGVALASLTVKPGEDVRLPIKIEHGGPNVIELAAEVAPHELTAINNKAVVTIEGIRDKLRVLLVSGEPHPGERIWRNTLKSDANIDLVHFTILRRTQKQDGTPINELSLIAFPTRELFETKIAEFDLMIFDRYSDLAILPVSYFNNIARYVQKGGAVLVAAGPEFAGPNSLAETPLRRIFPALPDGHVLEAPYLPRVTEPGKRHPVTRALPGGESEPPQWGEWVRQISAVATSGTTVMSGVDNKPLLLLKREGKGRVALLLSDHAWLWARDFRGGGPHLDLLRRTGHWLMKEPELEEEALRAFSRDGVLTIERQTMADSVKPITLIAPSGAQEPVTLEPGVPGLWTARLTPKELGLYSVKDDDLIAFAPIGPANPLEFQMVISSPTPLAALAEATGGSSRRLAASEEGAVHVPNIIALPESAHYAGADYLAIRSTNSFIVKGLSLFPLCTGLLGLAVLALGLIGPWISEGRRRTV